MVKKRSGRLFRRILHPSDFSRASRPAFRQALQLAKASGAHLLIAHVLPVLPPVPNTYLAAPTYDALLRWQRVSGQRQLDHMVRTAKTAGVRTRGILLDFGSPAEILTRFANSRRVDMIVMGTSGRTGLARALLGSVAGRVVARATCPVLTVRAR